MAPMSFGLKDDEEEDALLKRKYKCFVSKENYITYFVERNDTTKQSTNENLFSKGMFHIQS